MSPFLAETWNLAELNANSGVNFRNIVLGVLGTLVLIVLAGRSLGAFADERYGKLASLVGAAIPVVGFCYFPDETVSILKGLFQSFTG